MYVNFINNDLFIVGLIFQHTALKIFKYLKVEKPISVLDIMQRAICHGRLVDTNELKTGSLGYISSSTSKIRGLKSLNGIKQTAQFVLSSINNDVELNQHIWNCVSTWYLSGLLK